MVLKLFQYHIKKQISKDVTNKIEKMNYHLSKSESKDFMPCVGNLWKMCPPSKDAHVNNIHLSDICIDRLEHL